MQNLFPLSVLTTAALLFTSRVVVTEVSHAAVGEFGASKAGAHNAGGRVQAGAIISVEQWVGEG